MPESGRRRAALLLAVLAGLCDFIPVLGVILSSDCA